MRVMAHSLLWSEMLKAMLSRFEVDKHELLQIPYEESSVRIVNTAENGNALFFGQNASGM